jgi:hypothetical protein
MIRQALPPFQKVRPNLGGRLEVDITSGSFDWPSRRKNLLIMVTLKFLKRRADCVFVYPPFDHENICIHTMRNGQKRVNTK